MSCVTTICPSQECNSKWAFIGALAKLLRGVFTVLWLACTLSACLGTGWQYCTRHRHSCHEKMQLLRADAPTPTKHDVHSKMSQFDLLFYFFMEFGCELILLRFSVQSVILVTMKWSTCLETQPVSHVRLAPTRRQWVERPVHRAERGPAPRTLEPHPVHNVVSGKSGIRLAAQVVSGDKAGSFRLKNYVLAFPSRSFSCVYETSLTQGTIPSFMLHRRSLNFTLSVFVCVCIVVFGDTTSQTNGKALVLCFLVVFFNLNDTGDFLISETAMLGEFHFSSKNLEKNLRESGDVPNYLM